MLVSLNWLRDFVDIKISASDLARKLTMCGFEVEGISEYGDDTVLDINVTPNRGDCLSIIGIAREVSAITGDRLKPAVRAFAFAKAGRPKGPYLKDTIKIRDFISVEIKDKARCPRYSARVVDGVKIDSSPKWLSSRLEACGIRSINNVVDATNYMMLETGQPFHAFDHRFIKGNRIIVDTPRVPMEFITLDGQKRQLTTEDLLINDAEGPIALAGVMGGLNSEVKADTTRVVLESACFDPVTVRRTAKRLGVPSESSRRFEKGVDISTTVDFMNRLASLIVSIAGGRATLDWVDVYPKAVKPVRVRFSLEETNSLLGTDIRIEQVKRYLKPLGIGFNGKVCTIPTYRPDLTRPADITEEIARLYGYDRIPVTMPAVKVSSMIKPLGHKLNERAKEYLISHGFFEAINYGFCSPAELEPFTDQKTITITNPLGTEFSAMKPTLIPGLLNNLKLNLNAGQEAVRLFELRPVFLQRENGIKEEKRLSGVIYGPRSHLNWAYSPASTDFYDIKGICQGLAWQLGLTGVFFEAASVGFMHPQASARMLCNGMELGLCGLLHPAVNERMDIKGEIFVFELCWDGWIDSVLKEKKVFRPIERFPAIRRDVALLLSEDITSADVLSAVNGFGSPLIRASVPFDVYRGKGIPEGKKSVAYAVIYSDPERTLTDEEVNGTHAKLVGYLKDRLGADVR